MVTGSIRKRKGEAPRQDAMAAIISVLALEMPLSNLFVAAKEPLQDGERARIIELPIADRANGGIYADQKPKNSKKKIKKLRNLTREHYGSAMHKWVQALTKYSPDVLATLRRNSDKKPWLDQNPDDGLEVRIAEHFDGLWFTAKLLRRHRLIPISLKNVKKVLRSVYASNLELINPERQAREELRLVNAGLNLHRWPD